MSLLSQNLISLDLLSPLILAFGFLLIVPSKNIQSIMDFLGFAFASERN